MNITGILAFILFVAVVIVLNVAGNLLATHMDVSGPSRTGVVFITVLVGVILFMGICFMFA